MIKQHPTLAEFAALLLVISCAAPAECCDCWVALSDATHDGSVFDATEKWEIDRQQQYESKAMALSEDGNHAAARETLRHFVDENAARVGRDIKALNRSLPAMLDDAGIEYLYRDYLEEWIRAKKIPLRLPK